MFNLEESETYLSDSLKIDTIKALSCLGFIPSNGGSLEFQFENCEIMAFNRDFSGRIAFIGSMKTAGRTLYVPLEFYLPEHVASVQQCAALLFYYLRHYPIQASPLWLREAEQNQNLLPWMIDAARRKANYDALPKCFVRREWLRLALRQLEAIVALKSDETCVWLNYADEILSITCDVERFVVSARGSSWPTAICMRACEIRDLPKRLRGDEIPIVVGGANLQIGTKYYSRQTD